MRIHLVDKIEEIAESKAHMSSFSESRMREIERELEDKRINAEEAMKRIEHEFGGKFSRQDYEDIKKVLP